MKYDTIAPDVKYIGVDDLDIDLFEGQYDVPLGVSYNSYLIDDEKVAIMDTVDATNTAEWEKNLEKALGGKTPDYLIVQHLEPDHGGSVQFIMEKYPNMIAVCSQKAVAMFKRFFEADFSARIQVVKEGETLSLGEHTLQFFMVPMIHWPEVMMTYDKVDKILFSADAFGTFGALNGNIYADEVNFDRDWLDDARRYYINIVGQYGVQVQNVLKKASALDIQMICPLHGPVWREDLGYFIGKHDVWSSYKAEEKGVLVIYGSIYGHTGSAAEKMASVLASHGVKGIAMYDASHTDASQLVAECFRYSHLVLASSTYNAGIFTPIENLLHDLKAHSWQNRTVAIIENGTWAAQSGKAMRTILEEMKNITILGEDLSLKSAMKDSQVEDLEFLANLIVANLDN